MTDQGNTCEELWEQFRRSARASGNQVSDPRHQPFDMFGIKIHTSPYMLETKWELKIVTRTFRERWFPNFFTEPFEPWVKTKIVRGWVTVPSTKILKTDNGFIMHPALVEEFKEQYRRIKESM
jgi:hypothetical protein